MATKNQNPKNKAKLSPGNKKAENAETTAAVKAEYEPTELVIKEFMFQKKVSYEEARTALKAARS